MKLTMKSTMWPLLGLFLCVLGVKFWLIGTYGSPTPFWDQWDAEATVVYLPWADGSLSLSNLFAAHNEHRILWTRAIGLLELQLNGGIWDPLFQMTANAVLHGLALLLLIGFLRRELPATSSRPLILFSLTLALPFGWGNTLWGFQSQFYFLLLFGLLSIRWLTGSRPLSIPWWMGFLALVAAFFSVASGFLAGPAVAACYLLQMVLERRLDKRKCAAIGILLGYAILAYALTPTVALNAPFKAAGIRAFTAALLKGLALPFHSPAMVAFTQLPFVWLLFHLAYKRQVGHEKPTPWFLVGTAIWVYLNAAAMAYGRGAGGEGPSSRFMDTLYLSPILNFAAFLYLGTPFRSRLAKAGLWGWGAVLLAGMLMALGTDTLKVIPEVAHWQQIREANTQQFLSDFDRKRMEKLHYSLLPFYPADRLADLLENESIRALLPTPLRHSLRSSLANNWFFMANGASPSTPARPFEKVWGSFGPSGPAWTGQMALDYDPPRKGGYLEIPVAGYPGEPGLSLRMETAENRPLANLAPRRNPGDQWHSVYIRNPNQPFRIVAEDSSASHWVAFAEPKEVGPATLLTRIVLPIWFVFLGVGIVILLLVFAPTAYSR